MKVPARFTIGIRCGETLPEVAMFKDTSLPFTPWKGMKVEGLRENEAREVLEVTWELEEEQLYVFLGILDVSSPNDVTMWAQTLKAVGWYEPGDDSVS